MGLIFLASRRGQWPQCRALRQVAYTASGAMGVLVCDIVDATLDLFSLVKEATHSRSSPGSAWSSGRRQHV
jgi:hypothetical protein